jgi:hypothetical protein
MLQVSGGVWPPCLLVGGLTLSTALITLLLEPHAETFHTPKQQRQHSKV